MSEAHEIRHSSRRFRDNAGAFDLTVGGLLDDGAFVFHTEPVDPVKGMLWLDESEDAAVAVDFDLLVALGLVSGYSKVNKFGAATDCDTNVDTDVWDGADGTTSTDVWVAPTAARLHDLASTSANDAAAGTGARTVQVYGLTDWDTAETSEIVTLNGASNVATVSSYVIVHRIRCLTFGSGETNAGIITATAQTDATVTAAIQAGEGQTLMAIYGIPSTQTIHLKRASLSTLRGLASVTVDATLLVKENADASDSGFITKDRFQLTQDENALRDYYPPKSFTGPCIVKLQVNTSANNASCTGEFDAYVVDN